MKKRKPKSPKKPPNLAAMALSDPLFRARIVPRPADKMRDTSQSRAERLRGARRAAENADDES